jgi:hypothetical protein
MPTKPWEKISMDIVGPIQTLPYDCRYAITLTDLFSKWPECVFVPSVSAETCVTFLRNIFRREGFPQTLLTDHGTQFLSFKFRDALRQCGIRHSTSAIYNPRCNGQVERFNKDIKHFVESVVYEELDPKAALQDWLQIYRATPHATTSIAPSILLHGRIPRTTLDIVGLEHAEQKNLPFDELRKRVKDRQEKIER